MPGGGERLLDNDGVLRQGLADRIEQRQRLHRRGAGERAGPVLERPRSAAMAAVALASRSRAAPRVPLVMRAHGGGDVRGPGSPRMATAGG